MKKWEYRADGMENVTVEYLNGFGSSGWELVSITPQFKGGPGKDQFVTIFKRELCEPSICPRCAGWEYEADDKTPCSKCKGTGLSPAPQEEES